MRAHMCGMCIVCGVCVVWCVYRVCICVCGVYLCVMNVYMWCGMCIVCEWCICEVCVYGYKCVCGVSVCVLFLWCWSWNLGSCECLASTLPLSHPSPRLCVCSAHTWGGRQRANLRHFSPSFMRQGALGPGACSLVRLGQWLTSL